jgi:hypothetical protein
MQKLSITKRPGEIKGSIASRPELHGDDVIGAITVTIGDILLFPKDLATMYNDEESHSRIFKKSDAGLVPAFPATTMLIDDIFKGAKVTIQTDDLTLVLKPATVKDITLIPNEAGGHVVMKCKILGAPADDSGANPLHMLGKKCRIAILNGALASKEVNENQGDLPLEGGGLLDRDDDADGDGDDDQRTAAEHEEDEATRAATVGRSVAPRRRRSAPRGRAPIESTAKHRHDRWGRPRG